MATNAPLQTTTAVSTASTSPPATTPGPLVHFNDLRQVGGNTCGYWVGDGQTETITCSGGTPCSFAPAGSGAVAYCSTLGALPITQVYPYGDWPYIDGCLAGGLCCPADFPYWGQYVFDSGATTMFDCFTVADVSITATTALASSSPTTPSSPSNTDSGSSSGLGPGPWTAIAISSFLGIIAMFLTVMGILSSIYGENIRDFTSRTICCGHCGRREDKRGKIRGAERHELLSPEGVAPLGFSPAQPPPYRGPQYGHLPQHMQYD